MISNPILNSILDDIRTVAKGGVTQAQAYANIRDSVPTLFPERPTVADINAVIETEEFSEFRNLARLAFAEAYFEARREIDDEMVDMTKYDVSIWSADKKIAKDFGDTETKIRKACQDYVRVAYRQNVTMLIPEAIDAAKPEPVEKLPDPTGVLALVTEALVILSEKSPDAALALLNGLDSLVKTARPHVAARQPIPRKA